MINKAEPCSRAINISFSKKRAERRGYALQKEDEIQEFYNGDSYSI